MESYIETDDKRKYFLKMPVDFFTRPEIIMLMAQKNGNDMFVLFMKMLTQAANRGGYLRFTDSEPYTAEIMAVVFSIPTQIVEAALVALVRFDLIEIMDDKTIRIVDFEAFVTSESVWAEKKRKQRENAKRTNAGHCPPKSGQCPIEIEKEIEIEQEIEKESYARTRTREDDPPKKEDVRKYIRERKLKVSADVFCSYYEARNWMAGNNSVSKNWQHFVDLWDAREREKTPSAPPILENDYTSADIQYMTAEDVAEILKNG